MEKQLDKVGGSGNGKASHQGFSPTPPLPQDLPPVELTENSRQVLVKRYVRRGADGQPIETVEEMFWRVAYHVAKVEETWQGDVMERARAFYRLLTSKSFFPNSPTFTGAGTPLGQLAACFVLAIADDMGRHPDGIFQTLRNAALIQQTGGGNGFSFSRLRPQRTLVNSSAGQATGPVGFLRVYDNAFGEIAQGGCLLPDTLVFTSRGLLRLDEIANSNLPGWQNHTLQVATDQGWKQSPRAFNNGTAPVLRVHTRSGLSIAGTYQHRVKVMTDQGPEWRALQELQKGDWLLVKLGEQRGKLQALRQPECQHSSPVMPQLPTLLDEEFAFFLGYLTGDGFVASQEGDQRVGVSIARTSYLIEEMPALMQRLFGVQIHSTQKANDKAITLMIDNAAVKAFLQLNGLEKGKSREARVPLAIRQSPPEVVGAYLRGLFEADGTLSHGYPQLTTPSARLVEEVAALLIGLGCPIRIRSIAPGVTHFGEATVYQVRIESAIGLEAWKTRIGCDLRSRFVAAHQWQPDQERESSYTLPCPRYWLQPVLEAVSQPQTDEHAVGQTFHSSKPPLRRSLLPYLRGDRALTQSAYARLGKEYPLFKEAARTLDGLWFVQVAGTEAAGEALTLDLEVEDNHTYLAYGLVTHNTRRGANMGVLRVDHPDIEEFITCKTDEHAITNFNISVGITDAFMQAVEKDEDWNLRFPDITSPLYRSFHGTFEQAEAAGIPFKVHKTVRARDLFNKIVHQAHHNGEPGMLFLDAANRSNPVPHLYQLEATNPCGEQWLGANENCCLGSVNLAQHMGTNGSVDWEKLRQDVQLATIFLDDVVEANAYVPAVPTLKEAAHRARRIGLGIMGLADLMYHAGIRYGSPEGQEFGAQVMEFVRYTAMQTSNELAKARGPFPAIQGSIYDPDNFRWQPPVSIVPYEHDWGRPEIHWNEVDQSIRAHGIRNAAQTTIAPTGTIATVAGCEGYGCEPVFALAYIRHVNDNGKDLKLTYASPQFENVLQQLNLEPDLRAAILEQIMREGTCQGVEALPEAVRSTFVVSADISAEEHVRTQAALQAFVDNSLSKTINFPAGTLEDEVAKAYQLAWKLGCKGITVYVTGSRDVVVLETHATADKKQSTAEAVVTVEDTAQVSENPSQTAEQLKIWHEAKRPRPRVLPGYTYNIQTPLGKTFVTVNENGGQQPFEVFITCAKAGSDTAAVSDAIGRLISYVLRLASPVEPQQRLMEVVRQLAGIGGGRPMGFGPNRVRSLPDGVAQVLADYLMNWEERLDMLKANQQADLAAGKTNGHEMGQSLDSHSAPVPSGQPTLFSSQIGDLCPECGQAAVINEEGCRKCYACGYSEC